MVGLRDQAALSVLGLSLLVHVWTVNGLTEHSNSEISYTAPEQHVEDRRAGTNVKKLLSVMFFFALVYKNVLAPSAVQVEDRLSSLCFKRMSWLYYACNSHSFWLCFGM